MSPSCCLHWPKGWTLPLPSESSATGKRPLPPGSPALESTLKASTSTFSVNSSLHMSSWTTAAEEASQPHPRPVAMVGHRPQYKDSSCLASGLKVTLQGLGHSGRLNTAFIERVNLTVHHAIAALARRSWATSQQASQLLAHLEWWRAYYHFVRPHQALRVALVQPRKRGGRLLAQRSRQQTPAMAAGRTNRRWNVREVLSYPLLPVSA